jgi:LuxR family maltose regulon positive regulatory protein
VPTEHDGVAAIAGVLDRPRLRAVLDSPLVRVCVVQGPSGSGKTTLVRGWAVQRDRPPAVTWVSIGNDITDRLMFWQRVVDSAVRLGGLSPEAAAGIREQLGAAVDPVRIATDVLVDAGPVVLILDAYENLDGAIPEVDEDLARLVVAAPELRLMITTRASTALTDLDPPGGIARVITLGELSFTPDEIAALIVAQTGIDDDRLALSVARATKGFALTVRAVILALSQLGHIPRVDSMEWDAVVAARLESLLPDAVAVQFVTDTSVPPYVDAELGQQLSGSPAAAQLLDTLERNGFGRWIPYARHRPVFQYVQAIRDTFRSRAADDEARFRRSCTVAAHWLLENEDVDRALMFAIDGGDYALADRIFVRLLIANPDSYTTGRFLQALQKVPEPALRQHPMLAFGLGLALATNPILRTQAPRAYRIAIDSPERPPYVEPSIDAFSHDGMRAIAQRLTFAFRASGVASLDAVRTLDAISPAVLERFGDHVGTILRQLSYSLLLDGRIEEATETINRSVMLCTTQTARNYSIVYAAGIEAFAGDVSRARNLLARLETDAWPEERRGTYLNGLGVVAEAYVHLDALDFTEAARVLRDTDCFTPTTEFWPFLTAISMLTRHGLGQAHAEAQRVARELAGTTPPAVGDNVATEHLHAMLAFSWIAGGDHRAAARVLDAGRPGSPYLAGARTALLLSAQRSREALREAQASLELPGHTRRTTAETQTFAAVAALREGERDLARRWLDDAAVMWETYGTRVHVALLDVRDRRLLREFALDQGSTSLQRYLDSPAGPRQSGPAAVVLTPREGVVLAALATHDSIRAIAEALVVSPHTIKTQLQGIYRKLGVSSRLSALAVAGELGLLADRTER